MAAFYHLPASIGFSAGERAVVEGFRFSRGSG